MERPTAASNREERQSSICEATGLKICITLTVRVLGWKRLDGRGVRLGLLLLEYKARS